ARRAPQGVLGVMRGTGGRVLGKEEKGIWARGLTTPPYSCAVPGRKPGTSTKVTIGMLKASQKRTNRAALRLASESSTPASTIGWLATKPTVRPAMRPEPVTMLRADASEHSKETPSSTALVIHSLLSSRFFC